MDASLGTLRFALRSFRRTPSFTVVVVGTIAIAIAATATMLSVVNAAILRPLPFRDARQLVFAQGYVPLEHDTRGVSYPEAMDWRSMSTAFSEMAAYDEISLNIGNAGDPLRADAEIVSSGFFRLLGVDAAQGRTFTEDEVSTPDAVPVVVIGHELWQNRFGGSPDVVGRAVTVNDRRFTIVGVMPPGFRGLSFDTDVWIPMMMVSAIRPVSMLQSRPNRWLGVVGRLRDGLSVVDAQRDLDRVAAQLAVAHPETNTGRGALVTGLQDYYLGSTRTLLLALFGAVGFLLLIACANVMNLQLVRAAARRRELALRSALGADRGRLLRQLLVEGMLLSAMGSLAGVLLALWGVDALLALAPDGLLPAYAVPSVDGRVLGFTAIIAAAAGALFGLTPALARSGSDLVSALKDGTPSVSSGFGSLRRVRAQQVFVIAQIALALVLVTGATLMVRSTRSQLAVEPGFRADSVLAARLMLPRERYGPAERARFASQLVERLGALPGVTAAAVASDLPLRGLESGGYLAFEENSGEEIAYLRHRVSPEFFRTLGVRLERGRLFTAADGADAPPVAIVSEPMARRLWPGRDPIGQRISLAGTQGRLPWVEVVGVVGDVRFRDLTGDLMLPHARVDVYFPFAQQTDETLEVAVRAGSAESLASAIREQIGALDPSLPVYEVAPLRQALDQATASTRFGSLMLSLFAAIALVLAAVGVYGLLAFVVGTSGRDIAIRMALGAASYSVVALVLRKGMILAAAGGAIGLLLCLPSMRLLGSLLYGIRANDPATLGGVTALLLSISLLACWFPARRASRVDPQTALKSE